MLQFFGKRFYAQFGLFLSRTAGSMQILSLYNPAPVSQTKLFYCKKDRQNSPPPPNRPSCSLNYHLARETRLDQQQQLDTASTLYCVTRR